MMAGESILPPNVGPAQKAKTVYGSEVMSTTEDRPEAQADQRDYDDATLLQEAQEFLERTDDIESGNRNRAQEMYRFCYRRGSQWPDRIRREREADNRPCLEFNQMPSFINQNANDFRQNRPSIKVRGASDDSTVVMAEIRQDLLRHIENDSSADQCYDIAYRYMVVGGFGYLRVVAEYEQEDSFDQKLCIKPIPNPLSVYFDAECSEPDGSDAEKCLVTREYTRDEFYRQWPDAMPSDFHSDEPRLMQWLKPDGVLVADYYHKVRYKDTLYLLQNGKTQWESDWPDGVDKPVEMGTDEEEAQEMMERALSMTMEPPRIKYKDKREVDRCKVAWETITGVEVLERHEWKGSFIPVIPVWGDTTEVDGQLIRQGLVERAQDAQQMYNFWLTTATEVATQRTKAPWLVVEGMVDGRERQWGNANIKSLPYLTYKRFSEDGQDMGQPIPNDPDISVGGMLEQANLCLENMRQVIGIGDPLQSMQTQDESGRAILAKERIASTATFHFMDNFNRGLKLAGKVLLDLVPHYYDGRRTLMLLREDGSDYQQEVNQPGVEGLSDTLYDMTTGDYDVVIDTGPSYQSKRVEFVNSVMDLTQANPQLWQIAGDLLVKNMDWPGAESIADRLKVMLPPPILQLEAQKSKDPQVIAMNQAMQQQQQESQQQMQAMQQQMGELAQKSQKTEQENQALKSQVYQGQMALAQARAQAADRSQEAQADVQTQMMESADVQTHARIDVARLSAEVKEKERQYLLDVFDRALEMVKLQQAQMQPVGPEASGFDRNVKQGIQ